MADSQLQELAGILRKNEAAILQEWLQLQEQNLSMRNNLLKAGELEQQCREFLTVLGRAFASARDADVMTSEAWAPVREVVGGISKSRARQGFTPVETAL